MCQQERHWRSICLAYYLASRDFFTQVLYGVKDHSTTTAFAYGIFNFCAWSSFVHQDDVSMLLRQDVFRLAFLKMNASSWVSPARPGLVGAFMMNGWFLPAAMVQLLGRIQRLATSLPLFLFTRGSSTMLTKSKRFACLLQRSMATLQLPAKSFLLSLALSAFVTPCHDEWQNRSTSQHLPVACSAGTCPTLLVHLEKFRSRQVCTYPCTVMFSLSHCGRPSCPS